MNEIAHLIAQPWLMNERIAAHLYAQYMGGKLSLPDLKAKAQAKNASIGMAIGTHANSYKVKTKSGKNVAVMPVVGTLTKRGEMCSYGMKDYMNEIAALNLNEEISAIVLDMEGPGGTVDGTPEFGMAVKSSKKPIVTFGDNMIASANYWVASQSKWIVGNKNNPTEFGSIGVLCVHEYWGKFIEENIGEVKIIRAPQSVDKALVNPIEALTPELEDSIKEDLRSLAKDFHATVKKGRGARLTASEKDWGTGKMYKTGEAMELGLIDAVGTLNDAINKAVELATNTTMGARAQTNASNTANNKIQNMNMTKVARKVSSFFTTKKAAVKAAEGEQPAAADDATPMWTAEMVFNTDGSADGAFCLHPDADGNDRKFETKLDNNTGNEPPTDVAITEDDNWALVAEAAAPVVEEPDTVEAPTAGHVLKLNAALKNERAAATVLKAKIVELQKEKHALEATIKANEKKPAAAATTVVASGDNGDKPRVAKTSWEKKAAIKAGYKLDAEGNVLNQGDK